MATSEYEVPRENRDKRDEYGELKMITEHIVLDSLVGDFALVLFGKVKLGAFRLFLPDRHLRVGRLLPTFILHNA